MRATYVLTAAIALLAPALATPAGHNPETQLESRATRSSQGWYAYGCYMGELSIHLLALAPASMTDDRLLRRDEPVPSHLGLLGPGQHAHQVHRRMSEPGQELRGVAVRKRVLVRR